MAVIRGQVVAEQAMRALSGAALGPDVVHRAYASLKGDAHAVRAFHGRVQKALIAGVMPGVTL